jgi:hypothetical protein
MDVHQVFQSNNDVQKQQNISPQEEKALVS